MARGPEAFADAGEKAIDPGHDLVLAIKKEETVAGRGGTDSEERGIFQKNRSSQTRTHWQFPYEFWMSRGEIKP
jgi:hypothetical protein